MAANVVAQSNEPATAASLLDHAVADGPYREELAAADASPNAVTGVRITPAGFRVLHYDGVTARIDLALTMSVEGTLMVASVAYELVWQDGDWRISSDLAEPLNMARIHGIAGYVPWGP